MASGVVSWISKMLSANDRGGQCHGDAKPDTSPPHFRLRCDDLSLRGSLSLKEGGA